MEEEEKIISYIKQNKSTPISNIAKDLNIHFYKVQIIINKLISENKIKSVSMGKAIYLEGVDE